MILKLKESIMCAGEHYRPPSVVDTEILGIEDIEAEVLIRRGTAVRVEAEAKADEVRGEAAVELAAMKKADLVAIAADLGIETSGLTKDALVKAIEAANVSAPSEE